MASSACGQVYVWDTTDADPFTAVSLISRRPDGTPSSGAGEPDISRDGTVVSVHVELTRCSSRPRTRIARPTAPSQVFVADRDLDDDREVDAGRRSVDPDRQRRRRHRTRRGRPRPVHAAEPLGRWTPRCVRHPSHQPASRSRFPRPAAATTATSCLAEIRNGTSPRLTNTAGGVLPTQGVHAHPDLSDTGRTAVFDTAAGTELLGGDDVAGRRVVARVVGSEPVARRRRSRYHPGRAPQRRVVRRRRQRRPARRSSRHRSRCPTPVSRSTPTLHGTPARIAATVPAGGSCTVALSFTPTGPGPVSGVLTVSEAGYGAVAVTADVAGAAASPHFASTPAVPTSDSSPSASRASSSSSTSRTSGSVPPR